ncbi:low molecular weight phosphotyrosine protein phosphatase [Glutamicibacter sp. MNS18]|uniref:low molecular weight protein-tyrosine-phosphatase n=1 Tax=Glutamicibacter sp. MNS18 TaxID=2989817 RepID=UPI0022363B76|nr:low molecular weight protein-tyrosine-phosphatase [Glutamicibacter sp. MNS18]MCW4463965.1 low molecular weight phosphotyrosine protein phosphatase [Glutamicibacter sp. MNS18]
MFRIMTVCTGNICRSPMAEFMLKNALEDAGITDVQVISRAVGDGESGNPIDQRAEALLRAHGLSGEEHVATQITAGEMATMDLVLAMDTDHFEALIPELTQIDQDKRPQLRMLRSFDPVSAAKPHEQQGIYDPWYGDAGDFRETWKLIGACLPALVEYVRSNIASRGNR